MDLSIFDYHTKCFGSDADKFDRMKLSALLRGVQTVAGHHLDLFGLTFDYMKQNNSIFVVVKSSINFFCTPMREESLMFQTWTRKLDGLVFIRDTRVTNAEGKTVAEAAVNWILVDPEAHGILRPDALNYNIPFRPDMALEGTRTGRMRLPKEMTKIDLYTVRFTDCDFIGHMNNTVYADIVTNAIREVKEGKNVKSFDLTYNLEAKEGETLTIYRSDDECGIIWIRGEHERGKSFEARVELCES